MQDLLVLDALNSYSRTPLCKDVSLWRLETDERIDIPSSVKAPFSWDANKTSLAFIAQDSGGNSISQLFEVVAKGNASELSFTPTTIYQIVDDYFTSAGTRSRDVKAMKTPSIVIGTGDGSSVVLTGDNEHNTSKKMIMKNQ